MPNCRNCHRQTANTYFCSDDCRFEYHRRGMKPRPVDSAPAPKRATCKQCGAELSGKQRQWCSNKCRNKHARLLKRVRELRQKAADGRAGTSANFQDKAGHRTTFVIIVEVEAVQNIDGVWPYLVRQHLTTNTVLERLAQTIADFMAGEAIAHTIFVSIRLSG
jgi:hypothetical protein